VKYLGSRNFDELAATQYGAAPEDDDGRQPTEAGQRSGKRGRSREHNRVVETRVEKKKREEEGRKGERAKAPEKRDKGQDERSRRRKLKKQRSGKTPKEENDTRRDNSTWNVREPMAARDRTTSGGMMRMTTRGDSAESEAENDDTGRT
jgi:hypothetical protein